MTTHAPPLHTFIARGTRLRAGVALVAAVLATAALVNPAWAAEPTEATLKQLNVVQTPISALSVPQSDIKVDVWMDKANGVYVPGEKARIFVRTNKDAYLTVLNVNAKGETIRIFPNDLAPNNAVKAQTVTELGKPGGAYELVLSEPFGANLVKVVASSTRESVLGKAALAKSGAFTEVKSAPQELARQINVVVAQQPQVVWGMNQVVFAVAPQATVASLSTNPTPAPIAPPAPVAPVAAAPAPAAFVLPTLDSAFALDLRIAKSEYKTGESLNLQVTPEKDCSLSLVSFNSEGKPSVLYPNSMVKDVSLKAGRTTFLPSSDKDVKLTVGGTAGPQTLVAVCSRKAGFFANLFRSTDREVFPTVAAEGSVATLLSGGKGDVARASAAYTLIAQ